MSDDRDEIRRLAARVAKIEAIFELDYDEDVEELKKDLQRLRAARLDADENNKRYAKGLARDYRRRLL